MSSSSSSSSVLFTLIIFSVLFCNSKAVIQLPPNESIPAVIAFGDSIVDTGNNNYLKTLGKCNFPPYGQDFKGKVPTGRFGNGKVPSDLIAEELGIKELLPAYLDPLLQPQDLITGVCFASGGSGYDPLTAKLASALSMSDQLEMFKEYIAKLKGIVGEERTNFILSKSLFLVVAGSDDIANTYFLSHARELEYDIPSYTDLMLDQATTFFKEIYEQGARRIGVLSAPPIGCVPSQRTLAGGILRQCSEKYNQAAKLFNIKLSATLDSLNRNLPNSKMVYLDIYSPLLDLIENPKKYGFVIANKGCCGTGNIEVSILCNPASATCTDSSNFVFWDSYHPTEAAYRTLVRIVLEKYLSSFF
ncbi:GDSL esterase/lipase EXL3-like [Juglans microcarpa x Juglans regia]|uniref:GDSL esterase/lipase EXL3-like n=1 Tax=Juglans microcarpa x Juglans regia TaxID=2249226 RepID=UPI001B7ED46B|nr:GDSL esterase/lipase EXL3-like [Juglans microcarpa x Juglans regia]